MKNSKMWSLPKIAVDIVLNHPKNLETTLTNEPSLNNICSSNQYAVRYEISTKLFLSMGIWLNAIDFILFKVSPCRLIWYHIMSNVSKLYCSSKTIFLPFNRIICCFDSNVIHLEFQMFQKPSHKTLQRSVDHFQMQMLAFLLLLNIHLRRLMSQ